MSDEQQPIRTIIPTRSARLTSGTHEMSGQPINQHTQYQFLTLSQSHSQSQCTQRHCEIHSLNYLAELSTVHEKKSIGPVAFGKTGKFVLLQP